MVMNTTPLVGAGPLPASNEPGNLHAGAGGDRAQRLVAHDAALLTDRRAGTVPDARAATSVGKRVVINDFLAQRQSAAATTSGLVGR